ncbi:MAG: geranyl transferase [Rhodospirillaceae bacterium]|nr:geranyl transferase [Rhodospirillaceae bacterium]|tara:strand:- start:5591 stop:6505 length:915 start_codon:yes stop_codon:yes gene_type:complete
MISRTNANSFRKNLELYAERVNTHLKAIIDAQYKSGAPQELIKAMQYAVLGPGKRIRPVLTYASAELLSLKAEQVDSIAAAVELVHTYSLIHDDLPAMDDDDLRRGRLTTHREFNEATAILTGDALQAIAFEVLYSDHFLRKDNAAQIETIGWLAKVSGPKGMVGGQLLDIEAEKGVTDEEGIANIHNLKTGQLIRAAIMMPSELSQITKEAKTKLDEFASLIGLVFQIIDDLLETQQDTAVLGKSSKSDMKKNKATYPSVLGADKSYDRVHKLYDNSMKALDFFGKDANTLRCVADYIINRSH